MRVGVVVACCALSAAATAEVFRCVDDGGITLRDTACPSEPAPLRTIGQVQTEPPDPQHRGATPSGSNGVGAKSRGDLLGVGDAPIRQRSPGSAVLSRSPGAAVLSR
jgi:hypothetical protein